MRCLNCGWDNAPQATSCIKCGFSLTPTSSSNSLYTQNVQPQDGGPAPKKTVLNAAAQQAVSRETMVFPRKSEEEAVASVPGVCPHCGYPIAGGFSSCPNCGSPIGASPQPEVAAAPAHRPTIRRQILNVGETDPKPVPHCALSLIPEEGETLAPEQYKLEGECVVLNRDNTERENRTITTKEQALLTCEDGHWYLEDKSEMNTTYVYAGRKMELKSDDIIVMGNRRFRFSTDDGNGE